MPVPLPLAIALLVGGTALNYGAARKQDEYAGRALTQLADKSKAREREAAATFGDALASYQADPQGEVDEAATEKVARVEELFQTDGAQAVPGIPGAGRSPEVVKEVAKQLGDKLLEQRAELKALATIEAFGLRNLDKNLERQERVPVYQNLGIYGQGDRNVADAKLMAAGQQGQGMKLFGDLLTMAGAVGLAGAGAGAGGGAKATTAGAAKTGGNVPSGLARAFGGF